MKIEVEKRLDKTYLSETVVIIFSIILAVMFISIFLLLLDYQPIVIFRGLVVNSFMDSWGLEKTIVKTIPLLIIALGLSIVFKMEIWNIGGEGQFHIGAVGATWIAIFLLPDASIWLVLPVLLAAGFIGGAVWGGIAGFLKAELGVNEIVSTLMLNYIGILLVDFLVYGPWRDPAGLNFPTSKSFGQNAELSGFFNTSIHAGIFFALILAVIIYYFFKKTTLGFEMSVIGDNEKAARYAGINVKNNIIIAMMLSGGIAGFAGAVQMAGVQHQLQHGFSAGYGYTAIIVAWLARLNPFAIVLVSFIMAGLYVGGEQIQMFMQVPLSLVNFLQATILFFLLAGNFFNRYKINFKLKDEEKMQEGDQIGL